MTTKINEIVSKMEQLIKKLKQLQEENTQLSEINRNLRAELIKANLELSSARQDESKNLEIPGAGNSLLVSYQDNKLGTEELKNPHQPKKGIEQYIEEIDTCIDRLQNY